MDLLTQRFVRALSNHIVRVQGPIQLSETNQLQPDLAVLRPRADFYRSSAARPADRLLVIEVADASLRTDRDTKLPIYARAGIPEAWLADLEHAELVVYTAPSEHGYRSSQRFVAGNTAAPSCCPRSRLR